MTEMCLQLHLWPSCFHTQERFVWCGAAPLKIDLQACDYIHAPLQSFWWPLHVSETLCGFFFFCLLPHRWFPLLLAVVKGLPDLLRWYTLAALHQGYLQPLSTWRTAMIIRPPPSLPLSPPVRLNGSHVSPRPPRLMYSLLIWKRLGRSVHFFFLLSGMWNIINRNCAVYMWLMSTIA